MSEIVSLPEGWKRIQLKDAVDIHDYERKPINSSERADRIKGKSENDLFPYYGATGQVGWIDENLSSEESVLLGEDGAPFLDPNKDKAYIVRGKFWVNNHAHILRGPENLVDNRFISHQLNIINYRDFVSGSTRLKLTKSALEKLPLVICSEKEQARIVEKLEELLSDLDNGTAELKKAQAKLGLYRQSLLKSAVEGQLTQQWREQNRGTITETGQQLLERILIERRQRWEEQKLAEFAEKDKTPSQNWQDKYPEPVEPNTFNLPELPEGWVWASLDMLGDIVSGVTKGTKRKTPVSTSEVPYLRVANVQRGYLDLTEIKTIQATDADIEKYLLQKGDVLFNEGGDRDKLGRGWVWYGQVEGCIHQNHVFRMRPFLPEILPELVSHHGNTFGKLWFKLAGKQTTNLASINKGILQSFPVPLAPFEEQQAILGSLSEKLDDLSKQQEATDLTLAKATAQRKNILKDAFSGRLLPQNPDDEPANVLLEKIKAERAAKPKPTKSKRTKKPVNMKPINRESLRKWVVSLKTDSFDFEELSKEFPGDYETLKEIVFSELADESPLIEQYFDSESDRIKFQKVKA